MMHLLNPIVLRLQQKQVVLAYPFKYLSAVNGKAKEVVMNYQNKKNFTGCDDTSPVNPSCGIRHEKGVAIPYSEGFCCFCPEEPVQETQPRGGQDCSLDVGDPTDFEKQKYKASAHCLQFDDIWYTVSAMSDPIIMHETFLQVYNERHLTNGSSVWLALTHDLDFELGTQNPYEYDDNKTILATYMTGTPKSESVTIPFKDRRLLTPQQMPGVPYEKLPPALKNGATDFLLLPKNIIEPDGSECDTAGVADEAFAKQKDRCSVPKDTCLNNQPLDFWQTDNDARSSGQKGSYLLQNFGTPYKEPIIIDKETNEHWLALEYYEKHLTVITVEVNADNIAILAAGKKGQISKVVTASFQKTIDIHVNVLNTGLTPSTFSAQAVKCGYSVPNSNNQTLTVPPQMMEHFMLQTKPGSIELVEKFTCIVELSSAVYGVIAKREVTIKPSRRCICNMHCLCVCLGESLECEPMEEEDFYDAGFRGSLPILTAKPPHKMWVTAHPGLAMLFFILYLILIGLIKATFGVIGMKKVAHYGLDPFMFKPKQIKSYFESDLKDIPVRYNDEGFAVHPDTGEKVRVISNKAIFTLNVVFCFFFPCMKLKACMADSGSKTDEEEDDYDDDEYRTESPYDDKDYEDFDPSSSPDTRRSLDTRHVAFEDDDKFLDDETDASEGADSGSLRSPDLRSDASKPITSAARGTHPEGGAGAPEGSDRGPQPFASSGDPNRGDQDKPESGDEGASDATNISGPTLESKEAARWKKGTNIIKAIK